MDFKNKDHLFVWGVLLFVISMIYYILSDANIGAKKIPFSDFLEQVDAGSVKEVVLQGNAIEGKTR